ncbi:MAG: hypothetical protein WAW88_16950 [Nocardioides sp.]
MSEHHGREAEATTPTNVIYLVGDSRGEIARGEVTRGEVTRGDLQSAVRTAGAATCGCRFAGSHHAHHARLLHLLTDGDEVLELLELAVTWAELDYSESGLIPPNRWQEFADAHQWVDRRRVDRIISLALDVAFGSARASGRLQRAGG